MFPRFCAVIILSLWFQSGLCQIPDSEIPECHDLTIFNDCTEDIFCDCIWCEHKQECFRGYYDHEDDFLYPPNGQNCTGGWTYNNCNRIHVDIIIILFISIFGLILLFFVMMLFAVMISGIVKKCSRKKKSKEYIPI